MNLLKKIFRRKKKSDQKALADASSQSRSFMPASASGSQAAVGVAHNGISDPSDKERVGPSDTNAHSNGTNDLSTQSKPSISVSASGAGGGSDASDSSGMGRVVTTTHNTGQGFLMGAVNTDARNSVFVDNSNNVNVQVSNRSSDNADMLLTKLRPADRGGYYYPSCMDGTREQILEEVDKWLEDVNEKNILWLSGGPGAGKSTVASSIVSRLLERGRLGSFFFFRREDVVLSDPATLWRTVAYDLTTKNPDYANLMVETLNTGKVDLQWLDIRLHFKLLIGEPLKHQEHSIPPVIVIDALDECGSDPSHAGQRKVLMDTLIEWSRLPKTFKLIITGRDDRVPDLLRAACKRIILPTGADVSADANKDIRLFFEARFAEIGGSLFPEWPGERILSELTARAAGLFVWADTAMKLLEQGIPDEQLELIYRGHLGDEDNLTHLYSQVLFLSFQNANDRTLEMYKRVVSAIVLAKTPFHSDVLPQFLSQAKPSVKFILDKLTSVVSIGEKDKRVQIGHSSFTEFVCDPKRCPDKFLIDREKESAKVAMSCFERMKERLKFNICDLETSHLFNDEVEDLAERIKTHIPDSLWYSCRFWADHLQDTASMLVGNDNLIAEIKDFFHHRFMFWLEVMSFVKEVMTANVVLVTVTPWLEKLDTSLSAFARDASKFIVNFGIPISDSVPHIYLSALPFSPPSSLVAKQYQSQFPTTLSVVLGDGNRTWPGMVGICRGHRDGVSSVAISPDGKRVVSGSKDMTICIWDVATGRVTAGPFVGHTGGVTSVAFLPDGSQVVSGSQDGTISVWDVETGQVTAGPFERHNNGGVNSIALSPDGKRIVSGSRDKTVCVWDVETGRISAGPFQGHTGNVTSVAFSPDGIHVGSGSEDMTVCIWDTESGPSMAVPMKGHIDAVFSVAFSPDGNYVVSGSADGTICVWGANTGEMSAGPFQGHSSWVTSVTFSPNGKRIVSGSDDKSVCIWDVESGQISAGPFEGHTESVNSVVFSPDGKQVVSCSDDSIICIWDAETRSVAASPTEGHTNCVMSVAFSPDGRQVVSSSDDKTIFIWDVGTGQIIAGPFKGHTHTITTAAFSPDGKQIVSGSYDRTIRVWSIENGQIAIGPCKGHSDGISSVAFSPDGKQIVSGSNDETVCIWDVESGRVTAGPFRGHTDRVNSVAFSPDGKYVVSGSSDMTICVWDIETGHITVGPFQGHTGPIDSVAFSQDGKHIVSGSDDTTIGIWDANTGRTSVGPLKGHTDSVYSVAFSQDGKHVVSGSVDKTICIWDVETGDISVGPLIGHTDYIRSVAFSPDGTQIVSGSGDKTVRIWNIEPRPVTTSFLQAHPITGLDHIEGGWLKRPRDGGYQRLIWIPQYLQHGLWNTQTHLIIGYQVRVDLDHFVYGKFWTQCRSSAAHIPSDANK